MFKRSIVFMFVILAGFLFLVALPTNTVQAGPASPVTFTLTQPDGTTFTAIQWGDETVNGYETLDGYAIAQQAGSGTWYYLTVASDGALAPAYSDSSLMVVGQADPTGLKETPASNRSCPGRSSACARYGHGSRFTARHWRTQGGRFAGRLSGSRWQDGSQPSGMI